jgi:hypothetical protein
MNEKYIREEYRRGILDKNVEQEYRRRICRREIWGQNLR